MKLKELYHHAIPHVLRVLVVCLLYLSGSTYTYFVYNVQGISDTLRRKRKKYVYYISMQMEELKSTLVLLNEKNAATKKYRRDNTIKPERLRYYNTA